MSCCGDTPCCSYQASVLLFVRLGDFAAGSGMHYHCSKRSKRRLFGYFSAAGKVTGHATAMSGKNHIIYIHLSVISVPFHFFINPKLSKSRMTQTLLPILLVVRTNPPFCFLLA
jgi:hypothetical protein